MSKFLLSDDSGDLSTLQAGTFDLNVASTTSASGTFDTLTVTDTLTAQTIITEQELEVKDTLITCGVDNPADTQNLGLLEEYTSGGNKKWDGIVRGLGGGRNYVLKNLSTKPTPSTNVAVLERGELVAKELDAEDLNLQKAGSAGPIIESYGHRGTLQTPDYSLTGDRLLSLVSYGNNGLVGKSKGAAIYCRAQKPWTGGVENASYIQFDANDDGGIYTKMLIYWDKILLFGANSISFVDAPYNDGDLMKVDASGNVGFIAPGSLSGTLQDAYDNSGSSPQLNFTSGQTLGIKRDAGTSPLLELTSNNSSMMRIDQYSDNIIGATLELRKTRGSTAAPTAVASGDTVSSISSFGRGVTAYNLGSYQITSATEAWSDAAAGSEMKFYTCPNGSNIPSERLRLQQDGKVKINNAYLLPAVDGADKQFLTTDGAGNVSWSTTTSNLVADSLETPIVYTDQTEYRNNIGTTRYTYVHDQATDKLQIKNAAGQILETIAQDGTRNITNQSGDNLMTIASDSTITLQGTSPSANDTIFHTNGDVTIGTTTPIGLLTLSNPTDTQLVAVEYGNSVSPASFDLYKARGTPSTPANIINGDYLFAMKGYGYYNSQFHQSGQILMETSTWSATSRPADVTILTPSIGETQPTEKFRINSEGVLSVGISTATNIKFPNARGTVDQILQSDASGNLSFADTVNPPASSTDNAVPRFDGTTGNYLQNSGWTIDDSNIMTNTGGKLGLGTATPSGLLEVKDGATQILDVDDATGVTVGVDFRYQKGCAEFYAENNATATTTTLAATWYPVAFSDASSNVGQAVGFTVDTVNPNAGRITYNGSRDRICHIGVTLSFKSDTNSILAEFGLRINGVHDNRGHVKMYYANGIGRFESTAIHAMPTLSNGDYIELEVLTNSAGAEITVEECNIFAMAAPNVV